MEMDNGDSDYEQYIRDPALYMHMKISFIVELKRKEVCSMSSACMRERRMRWLFKTCRTAILFLGISIQLCI